MKTTISTREGQRILIATSASGGLAIVEQELYASGNEWRGKAGRAVHIPPEKISEFREALAHFF